MLKKFRNEFRTPKLVKTFHVGMCQQTISFRGTAQQLVDLSLSYFICAGT
jgi:hypothetical protein